jgi:hypothetical protein
MRIYLAARYSRRTELLNYKADLEAIGHTVPARWLLGNHQITDEEMETLEDAAKAEKRARFAEEDMTDLYSCEMTISFTEIPRTSTSRGGRHVEHGMAYARNQRTWIVGPRENVFHCLDDVRQFDTWPEAISALRNEYGPEAQSNSREGETDEPASC